MSIPMYPEIILVSRCPEIFAVKEVIATEKIHGSSARIGFPAGMESVRDVLYGSREIMRGEPGFPSGMNRLFQEQFISRPERLEKIWNVIKSYGLPDLTIFGEAFGPGMKARGVKYAVEGEENPLFRAFDMMVGTNFITYDLFCELADKMELPRVPELWRGAPTQEAFDVLLEKPSVEAARNGLSAESNEKNLAEGVVVRSNPLFRTTLGSWLIVKHKAKKFSEIAHAAAEKPVRGPSAADDFAAKYVTQARAEGAVARLEDRGAPLAGAMSDMPKLLDEVLADLQKEHGQEWAATGQEPGSLKGAVSRILGPMYRAVLAERKP